MSQTSTRLVLMASPSSFGVVRQIRCDAPDCQHPAVMRLDVHFFCLEHLIPHCHSRLEACQQDTFRHLILPPAREADIKSFLEECAAKVAAFLMARTELPNIDRARLLDVLLWATELDHKFGRSSPMPQALAKCASAT